MKSDLCKIKFTFFIILIAFGFSLSSVAAAEIGKSKKPSKSHSWLMAGQAHEVCMNISSKEDLYYKFSSTQPVEFDIHYHIEKKIHYPVRIQKYKSSKKIFSPKKTRSYCMLWSNINKRAVLLIFEHNTQSRIGKPDRLKESK